MEAITFPSRDGHMLKGAYFLPAPRGEKNPATLFIHGWKSSGARIADAIPPLVAAGHICCTVDLRGHGESGNTPEAFAPKDFLNDAIAAYDILALRADVDRENISVVGASLGGYLATLLSAERKIASLVLRAPANYPDENFEVVGHKGSSDPAVRAWRLLKKDAASAASLRALHTFAGDVLIVESELDEQVPHQVVEDYVHAVADKDRLTYVVIPGAEHSLRSDSTKRDYYNNVIQKCLI